MSPITLVASDLETLTVEILKLKLKLRDANEISVGAGADIGLLLAEARSVMLDSSGRWSAYLREEVTISRRWAYGCIALSEAREGNPKWFARIAQLGLSKAICLCAVGVPFRYAIVPESTYKGETLAAVTVEEFARALKDLASGASDDGASAHRRAEEEPPGKVATMTARVMRLQKAEPADAEWRPFLDWVEATWPAPVGQPADPAAMTVALRGLVNAAESITQIPTHAEREELARVTDALVAAIDRLQESPALL